MLEEWLNLKSPQHMKDKNKSEEHKALNAFATLSKVLNASMGSQGCALIGEETWAKLPWKLKEQIARTLLSSVSCKSFQKPIHGGILLCGSPGPDSAAGEERIPLGGW